MRSNKPERRQGDRSHWPVTLVNGLLLFKDDDDGSGCCCCRCSSGNRIARPMLAAVETSPAGNDRWPKRSTPLLAPDPSKAVTGVPGAIPSRRPGIILPPILKGVRPDPGGTVSGSSTELRLDLGNRATSVLTLLPSRKGGCGSDPSLGGVLVPLESVRGR